MKDTADEVLDFILTPMTSEIITENTGCKAPLIIAHKVPTTK